MFVDKLKIDLVDIKHGKEGTKISIGRYKPMIQKDVRIPKKEPQFEVSNDPYARGYHAGHIAGHEEGYDDGYTNGKEEAHKKQTNTDWNKGYEVGFKAGIEHSEESQRKKEFFQKNPPVLASILYLLENTSELIEALTLVNYVYDNRESYKEE